eukprot:3077373-Pleurochrysis_carterae.AAC.1
MRSATRGVSAWLVVDVIGRRERRVRVATSVVFALQHRIMAMLDERGLYTGNAVREGPPPRRCPNVACESQQYQSKLRADLTHAK